MPFGEDGNRPAQATFWGSFLGGIFSCTKKYEKKVSLQNGVGKANICIYISKSTHYEESNFDCRRDVSDGRRRFCTEQLSQRGCQHRAHGEHMAAQLADPGRGEHQPPIVAASGCQPVAAGQPCHPRPVWRCVAVVVFYRLLHWQRERLVGASEGRCKGTAPPATADECRERPLRRGGVGHGGQLLLPRHHAANRIRRGTLGGLLPHQMVGFEGGMQLGKILLRLLLLDAMVA